MGTCLNLDFVNSVAVMLGNYWLNNVVHLSSVRSVFCMKLAASCVIIELYFQHESS